MTQPPPMPPEWNKPPQGYGTPPPGYGPPSGYNGPPPPGYGRQRTNTLAIIAVVAIFVFAPAAIVFGILARNEIARTGEAGDGMALAGIIVGSLSILFVGLVFVLFFAAFSSGTGTY
jgi:hypothetical protein